MFGRFYSWSESFPHWLNNSIGMYVDVKTSQLILWSTEFADDNK